MMKKVIVLIILIVFLFFTPSAALSVTVSPKSLDYTLGYIESWPPESDCPVMDTQEFSIINNGDTTISYMLDIPNVVWWDIYNLEDLPDWVDPKSSLEITLDMSNVDEEPILPIGVYTEYIIIPVTDGDEETIIELPFTLHIIDCNAPPNPVPEFPNEPGFSGVLVSAGIIGGLLSVVLLTKMNGRKP